MSTLLSLFSFGTGNSGLTSCECSFLSTSCLSPSHREQQHLPGNWRHAAAAAACTRWHREVEMLLGRKCTRKSLVLEKNEVTGGRRKLRNEELPSSII